MGGALVGRLRGLADLWLLLVAGATLAGSVIRPQLTETFLARFDRVFFMECWVGMENVLELQVQTQIE